MYSSSKQPVLPVTLPRSSLQSGSTELNLLQTVKMGVQYSLWGGSILNLGTEKHRKAYFEDIDKFRLPGVRSLSYVHHSKPWSTLLQDAKQAASMQGIW